MKPLAIVSLLLVVVLVSLSAYLRLVNSGVGCAEWPECYGRIGAVPATVAEPLPDGAGTDQDGRAQFWATPLHRLVASVLGLAVLFLAFLALREKRHRTVALLLLALTVWLAVLGIWSGGLHSPAVVMGNLAGGFCMLGLLGWMVFSGGERGSGARSVAALAAVTIVLLVIQIGLGGLTSANFAALSCRTLPDCHGSLWPGAPLRDALDLSRTIEVTPDGHAVGGPERLAVNKAHRLAALWVLLAALAAAVVAYRDSRRCRVLAVVVATLAVLEVAIGAVAVSVSLPIALAVAHNGVAALLLLALLKLLALATGGRKRTFAS